MKLFDFRLLCTALGFTAIITHEGRVAKKDAAQRAKALAKLIENFCREVMPEAFEESNDENVGDDIPVSSSPESEKNIIVATHMAEAIVTVTKEKGDCLPKDLTANGFSPEEVDRYWAMAKALAYVQLNKTDPMDG